MPIDNGMLSGDRAAPSCMEADAYATALMVMGPEAGMAFAEAARARRALPVPARRRHDEIVERDSPELEAMLS